MAPSAAPPTVSVIIPVHEDTAALAALLQWLADSGGLQRGDEIVVSASHDDAALAASCQRFAARLVVGARGCGMQLNRGAASAGGDILWFVHADAAPAADAVETIRDAVVNGACGGWFQFTFAGAESTARRRLAALINWRARNGIAYGDQGLFFTRELFDACGGFEPLPLFEEVRLVKAARERACFDQLDAEIGVSPRRWERDGWIRRTLHNRALALAFACGVPATTLTRWYRRRG